MDLRSLAVLSQILSPFSLFCQLSTPCFQFILLQGFFSCLNGGAVYYLKGITLYIPLEREYHEPL